MANTKITLAKNSALSKLAIICLLYGAVSIILTALQWFLVRFLTPFLMAPALLCSWGLFAILMLITIVYFFREVRKTPKKASLPLLINIVTFLILWFVPFTSLWLEFEFKLNKSQYDEIVLMVENEQIQPGEIGLAQLPPGYENVSRGGQIIIQKENGVTSVFFFTFRGVLDSFSGYMYRSDDTPPPKNFIGDWFQIERKESHWFFCASQ
ncbi:hypothetical protein [Candidatus Leptofilum sp.]|uniref:hypothetical protein n=1 Tax=Candidatus Leptofilum sp. TaxID=3241576 RepID=UPI003B5B473A